ncbi:MAG: endonuclease/exonuclease/phosphatase family protein [Chloroflexi bacterium]|nr:endonuclease/exonuclease/phosphatase family protein [Chloroflexota bacterium]
MNDNHPLLEQGTAPKPYRRGYGRGVRHAAVPLVVVYAVGLLGLWLYRTFASQLPPSLALVSLFFPFLFAPTLFLWLMAPFLRSRVVWSTAVLLTLFWVVNNGWRWLPNPAPDLTAPTLKVMTFNMAMRDCYCDKLSEMAGFITAESPDFVVLQEVSEPMAAVLSQLSDYPYQELRMPTQTTALLSKYPIVTSAWHANQGERDYLSATIAWQGELVQVLAIHPNPPGFVWHEWTSLPIGLDETAVQTQLGRVAQHAAPLENAIIAGDFNMSDQSQAYHELVTQFEDAFVGGGQGWGLTFPVDLSAYAAPLPLLVRLDYIFHSAHFQATHVSQGCGTGSDHCYVIATLALKR